MKFLTSLVASFALLLSAPAAHAQAATTPTEYELAANGIAEVRAAGRALPAGYVLTGTQPYITGQFTITLEELRRQPTHELAAIVVQMQHPNWATPRYLCLPNATSDTALKQRYLTEVIALTPGNTHALATALALRLATCSTAQQH
jgi:hypothetical protein